MKEKGATLLEWVFAIALNALVLLILSQALVAARKTFSMIDAIGRVANNGRFVQDVLATSLFDANPNIACARAPFDETVKRINSMGAPMDDWLGAGVVGWEAPGTTKDWVLSSESNNHSQHHPKLPSALVDRVDPQSDVVLIHRLIPIANTVDEIRIDGLMLSASHGIPACGWVVASDCSLDVAFYNGAKDQRFLGWSGNACGAKGDSVPSEDGVSLGQGLWPDRSLVAIYEWQAMAWFVGPSDTGDRALYRARFDRGIGQPKIEAMAQNIETLQLEYATQERMSWQRADRIGDWSKVVGVRFALLASVPMEVQSNKGAALVSLPMLSDEIWWPSHLGYAKAFGSAVPIDGMVLP